MFSIHVSHGLSFFFVFCSQHDLRTSHKCSPDSANVLVNLLNHLGRYAEAKCVAVNPRRPYQLAVGANDFYVRLYDTRMIKLAKLQVKLLTIYTEI